MAQGAVSEIESKWGEKVADRGFAQVPNYLLFINQFVDEDVALSPLDLLLLIQLVGTWWKKGELPFPSIRLLAERCGTSERQVLRSLSKIEKLNLIKRVKRREKGLIASNAYDLSPLVEMLGDIAKVYPNMFPRQLKRGKV